MFIFGIEREAFKLKVRKFVGDQTACEWALPDDMTSGGKSPKAFIYLDTFWFAEVNDWNSFFLIWPVLKFG